MVEQGGLPSRSEQERGASLRGHVAGWREGKEMKNPRGEGNVRITSRYRKHTVTLELDSFQRRCQNIRERIVAFGWGC